MTLPRVIPCLLLQGRSLVKTVRFRDPGYIGDPINTVRIFNDLGVDEIIILDISAAEEDKEPQYDFIKALASECFMPLAYGGGVRTLEQIRKILAIGTEKIIINTGACDRPGFVREAAGEVGSQSILVSMDIKKDIFGKYRVVVEGGKRKTGRDPVEYAQEMEEMGAGEIFLNSIDRDGTWEGYDTVLISKISAALSIPVIACGGAGKIEDFRNAVKAGASAVAAGSMFVYQKKGFGVLIQYPHRELRETLGPGPGQT